MEVIELGTDGSYNEHYKVGAYAYYFTHRGKEFSKAKVVDQVHGSLQMELIGIAQGLQAVLVHEPKFMVHDDFKVIVYCDNLDALAIMEGKEFHSGTMRKFMEAYTTLVWIVQRRFSMFKHAEARHVKAHVGLKHDGSHRFYLNNWCDRHARLALREQIIKLKAQTIL